MKRKVSFNIDTACLVKAEVVEVDPDEEKT
jgi:hypothetical protein